MGPRRVGPRRVGPEGWGPERVGPRKGGAPKGVGPRKGGGPKISRFFFPFPPPFRCFCVSLGVFSWNFGGVLKRRCPEMCTFGVLGLSCASPGGRNGGGKGKKKIEILGGPAEGGPVEGGSGGRWSREVQTSNNHNNQEQQRQTQNKWGPEGPARSSQARFWVCVFRGHTTTQEQHNNTQHNNTTTQQKQQQHNNNNNNT